MCFGAKNDSYGTFNIQKTGTIFAFKLAHLSGGVTCGAQDSITKWGCGVNLNTHITNSSNFRLFPRNESETSPGFDPSLFYRKLPGFNYDSSVIEFRFFSSAIWVHTGQEFRIWYGEDLTNRSEEDNPLNKSCVDVYGFY